MPSSPMLKTPARSHTAPPSPASRIGVTKRGIEARKDVSRKRSSPIATLAGTARRGEQRARNTAGDEQDDDRLHDQRDFLGHAGGALHARRARLDGGKEEA